MEKREKRDELLLLAAVSGEIPADWIGAAARSDSYGAALLTRLKKDGELKLRSKDGIRGYLLRARAKRYLLERYREDTEIFLSGSAATNHVKSEPEKRLRLHRMSMVWIYFYRMGIEIFISDKPALFPGLYPLPSPWEGKGTRTLEKRRGEKAAGYGVGEGKPPRIGVYYGTGEWKLETDQEISGSRACGILAADCAYIVYNTMDSLMRWTPKIERNLRGRLELRFRKFGRIRLYGAVMLGTGMEMLKRLLDSDGGVKGNLYRIDETYEYIYYVPLIKEARLQVRMLCDREGRSRLRTFLCSALAQVSEDPFRLEAGKDKSGKSVYFCYLLDLWQIKRIREQRGSHGGRVFCFTYQAQILGTILGKGFEVEAIRTEKVCRYLGWEDT